MGKEIVRLCDGIERHGLVDYEYGVWEEPIIESMHFSYGGIICRETQALANLNIVLSECLDVYGNADGARTNSTSIADPSTSSY